MDGEKAVSTDTLTEAQGALLIRLARLTLMERLNLHVDPKEQAAVAAALKDDIFQAERGAFVTLTKGGELRGCIGHLTAVASLGESVRQNAVSAGFHDPRFPDLTAAELPEVAIEISILTQPQPLDYTDADDLVRRLRPGVDGVILSSERGASATFLPQVWHQLPDAERFLSNLCVKAGLPIKSWKVGDLKVSTYQVQRFEEHT
jgi:AmmeMemoRadiSam system protein A